MNSDKRFPSPETLSSPFDDPKSGVANDGGFRGTTTIPAVILDDLLKP